MKNSLDSEKILTENDGIETRFQFKFCLGSATLNVFFGTPFLSAQKEFTLLPHNHAYYELLFAVDNPAYIYIAGKEYLIGPQSMCVVHPCEYHCFMRPQNPDHSYRVYTVSFRVEGLSSDEDETELDVAAALAKLDQTHVIHGIGYALRSLMNEIDAEIREQRPGYIQIITNLLKCVICRILREVFPDKSVNKAELMLMRDIIIEQFYFKNYRSAPKVEELSRLLGVSDRRTNQIIQEIYHCSFSEKLAETRLEIAKVYLCYADYSIEKIATACGFPSLNFFFRSFRKYTGLSPNQYRKDSRIDKTFLKDIAYDDL